MAPVSIAAGLQSVRRSQHSSPADAAAAAAHKTASQTQHMLNPDEIAGITVGILAGLVLASFAISALINYITIQRRARQNAKIEDLHKRWENLVPMYPSLTEHDEYQPGAVSAIQSYIQPWESATVNQPDAQKIGVAISSGSARTESPESYQSYSSASYLLSKALPAVPPASSPPRPESSYTLIEDYPQSQIPQGPGSSKSTQGPTVPTRASSLRPRRPPPARIKIPASFSSSPPPIMIFPPNWNKPSRVMNQQQNGFSGARSQQNGSSRNFSSPPNDNASPIPSASRVLPTDGTKLLAPPVLGSNGLAAARKETPSYLPAYYTSPTPQPPVPPTGLYQSGDRGNESIQTPTKPVASSINTAALELEPSSASSDGSDTSFESASSANATSPENETKHTQPMSTGLDSPITNLRYPKIPRPTNENIPRTPPSGGTRKHLQGSSNMANKTSNARYGTNPWEVRAKSQQNLETPTRPERTLRRVQGDVQQARLSPKASNEMGQNMTQGQQWPRRKSSNSQPGDEKTDQTLSRTRRDRIKADHKMNNGDMFIEFGAP